MNRQPSQSCSERSIGAIGEKLDQVLERLTAIETHCEGYGSEIQRHRLILNGNGRKPGLVTQAYDHGRQLQAISKLHWWWAGVSASLAVAVFALGFEHILAVIKQ